MRKLMLTILVVLVGVMGSNAQRTISGKVTNPAGEPISNVSVTVPGTSAGTTTASDGTFSLTVPANGKQVEFSSINFESQFLSVNARNFNVVLAPSTKDLGEVVVTGINRIKKSQYTGAATKVDEKQLKNQPVGSFDQILQGRTPGLTVLTGSGAPGTASTLIIRGQTSIEGGSDPLYVVDGIPVETSVFQGLDPNTFASVDILRDASASALYGSRGSAGVVVVTLKKGVAGKTRFGYSAQFGVKSKPEFAFKTMSTTELLKTQHDYGKVTGENTNINIPGWFYSPDNPEYANLSPQMQANYDRILDSISKINTNWQDQIFRNGNFSNHQITLSGGTGKTRFYNSLSHYNEEGITLRSDMKRITLLSNLDVADDKFNLSLTNNISYTKRNFQQSTTTNSLANPFLTSAVNAPYAKVFNDDGSYATGIGSSFAAANQLDLTKFDENYSNQIKVILGVTAGYKFTSFLSASVTTGVDFRETQSSNYGSPLAFNRRTSTSITGKAGFQRETLTRSLIGTVRPSLTFRKLFREKHDVEVMALGEYVAEKNASFSALGYGVNPKMPNTIASVTQGTVANQLIGSATGGKTQNSLVSGLMTARYSYNSKYTLSASYRQDGSSKLPPKTRWQDFYSIGGVWEAGKEDFIRRIKAINSLRVKLSYGNSGNSNNFPGGDFPYFAGYGTSTYGSGVTIEPTDPGNPLLKWEVTSVTNLGIDFEIVNRRIYGDINLYRKTTKDLFVAQKLSATAGFGIGYEYPVNSGKLGNEGIELSLTGDVIRNSRMTWSVYGNFGYNKNEVKDLGGLKEWERGTELIKIGYPLGTHYEVEYAGVDAATGQPLYYTKEGTITNTRNAVDRVQKFGTWEAPWKGGFGSGLQYKGFDLSVLFSWQSGAYKVDNMEYFLENPAFIQQGYNQSVDLNFWQQPGDQTSTPNPIYPTNFSSKLIHDASFLRLRNIMLAYQVPKSITAKSKIVSGLRMYVQGSNLFMWTKWRGLDPEAGSVNINLSEFPNPRTITAGLDINF